jgi:hypothetical protein
LRAWLDGVFGDLLRQLRWSFLPPLMVYFAAGISGLTAIVGVFFVKDYLGLSAAFLAGLGFWAGLPWTLKLPLGHSGRHPVEMEGCAGLCRCGHDRSELC